MAPHLCVGTKKCFELFERKKRKENFPLEVVRLVFFKYFYKRLHRGNITVSIIFAVVIHDNVLNSCACHAAIVTAVFLHRTQAKFAQMSTNKIQLVR